MTAFYISGLLRLPVAISVRDKRTWTIEMVFDKTFAATGDMQQLNEAAKEVGAKLKQPDHQVKVVLMIPNPGNP